MPFIQLVLSLIILGIIYSRMIKRETPFPISVPQAVVPVILGVISVFLSFALFLNIGSVLLKLGYEGSKLPAPLRSISSAFFMAGLPEEIVKLVMILLTILIFRSRIRNVYEYILIGAAVGFGFTILEEFFYGSSDMLSVINRLITLAGHMIFGIIMARHLGKGRYNRVTGRGSAAGEYALAIIIPILIHTIFDACTGSNYLLNSEDDVLTGIGIVASLAAVVVLFIMQIRVLSKVKKKAEEYCAMRF